MHLHHSPGRRRPAALARSCTVAGVALALVVPLAGAAGAAGGRAPAVGLWGVEEPTPAGEYVTRPDIAAGAHELTTTTTGRESPGQLLTTPGYFETVSGYGTAIYENDGELVWWTQPTEDGYINLDAELITYQGRPALAAFRGPYAPGSTGAPEYVVWDTSYNEIASFEMPGYQMDSHEIEVSPDGSRVMFQAYYIRTVDLSPYGGPAEATVIDAAVQEQDIATGEVTFEWQALDHIDITETRESLVEPDPVVGMFDYLHLNSVDYTPDGDLLVSGRHTSTVYKVDYETGDILWRFGGDNSDFTFDDPAGIPSYQHDARLHRDGRLTLFDNGNEHDPQVSRGATYQLDEEAMTAELVEDLRAEPPVFGAALGSNQRLDNGNQLVSFGSTNVMAEYEDGEPVFTGTFEEGVATYRTERIDWHATPDTAPDAALGEEVAADGSRMVYMSWNGATDVRRWLVEAGPSEDELVPLGTARRTGFETAAEMRAPEGADVYRFTALGPLGIPLGSRTLTTS